MSDSGLPCYCGERFPSESLLEHFSVCPSRDSSDLHKLMTQYLQYLNSGPAARFLELELTFELEKIRRIRNSFPGLAEDQPIRRDEPSRKKEEVKSPAHAKAPQIPSPVKPPNASPKVPRCYQCESSVSLTTLDCKHSFCTSHLAEAFRSAFLETGMMKCWGCHTPIGHKTLRKALGDEVFDGVLDEMEAGGDGRKDETVECKCGNVSSFRPSPLDYTLVDSYGERYSREAAEQHSHQRFFCRRCTITLCLQCKVSPFHDGITCTQAARIAKGDWCRYCERAPADDKQTCGKAECENRLQISCKKEMQCAHKCFGVEGEENCPPCLQCNQELSEETCSICGTEKLMLAPMVANPCGHAYHFHCLKTRLEKRWTGNRISFAFAGCPICKYWTVPPQHMTEVYSRFLGIFKLYEEVRDMALARLNAEPEELKQVNDESDPEYFQQPEMYAMDRYCFYECFKCKRPYFGGKKQCNLDDNPLNSLPEEMLCVNCSVSAGSYTCPMHGVETMEYKCKYCCSVSKYFCWGTAHFCEECHRRQTAGEDFSRKRLAELPQCKGRETCPLGVDHPPNGKEFIVGCGICKYERPR